MKSSTVSRNRWLWKIRDKMTKSGSGSQSFLTIRRDQAHIYSPEKNKLVPPLNRYKPAFDFVMK